MTGPWDSSKSSAMPLAIISPFTAPLLPVISQPSHPRLPEISASGPRSTAPHPTFTSPLTGAFVNVPELGANVAFDGAFDLHITETRVDVALHLAAYEDVPKPGMHVVHYQSVYFEVTGPGRNVVLYSSMTNHDISNEPLLRRVRGERYDETEDHDRDGKQGQGVDPIEGTERFMPLWRAGGRPPDKSRL